jgi:hypothetical protein
MLLRQHKLATQLIVNSCKLHNYTHKTQIYMESFTKKKYQTEESIKIQGMLKLESVQKTTLSVPK